MKKLLVSVFSKLLSERLYLMFRFFYKHKKFPNLNSPSTFSEKLLVSKMNTINSFYTTCADKYSVRDIVKTLVGDKYLIPLLARFTTVEEFIEHFNSLPNSFALKAAHGSGWNEIVFNKESVNLNSLAKKVDFWLHENYFNYGYEKQYKDIQPSIVIEKLLVAPDGKVPVDYKFYCFGRGGSKRIIVQVDLDRFGKHERLFFDQNWVRSPISILSSKSVLSNATIGKPDVFDEMLDVVKKLSSEFEFSRIDLYEHEGKVFFGEITFHPESAYGMYIYPESAEYELGALIKH